MSKNFLISVIITTYNWPAALKAVLQSLAEQSDKHFEVIVADDGSTSDTRLVIDCMRPFFADQITHVWQKDLGFRAGRIRNKAILVAKGEYIIFIDGDSIPRVDFVAGHRVLAESGWFVAGNRLLLNREFTEEVLKNDMPIQRYSFFRWFYLRCKGKVNRVLPVLSLPLGSLRKKNPQRWRGAKTCNLAVWKTDLFLVNGFDEAFVGWGFEDSHLIVRLLHLGRQHKNGRFALPILHLWHAENDRSQMNENWQRFQSLLTSEQFFAKEGLTTHDRTD